MEVRGGPTGCVGRGEAGGQAGRSNPVAAPLPLPPGLRGVVSMPPAARVHRIKCIEVIQLGGLPVYF